MEHLIIQVDPGSEAANHGICPGDTLITMNGEELIDQIDYQALSSRRHILLHIRKADGKEWHLELIKSAEKPLGLHFGTSMELSPRVCRNKCIFCFIDQMPPFCRPSLYVKDDDWRMSLLMGNFITMTNMNDAEFDRIVRRKVSPLFISVHTADPKLRVKMMGNPAAAKLMDRLRILKDNGIRFHCQIVLCPGINDGAHLDYTLESLHSLYPAAQSAALVPVGLTRFREGLYPLRPYSGPEAREVIRICRKWQKVFLKETGSRFVFPSDELLCLAGEDLPDETEYENFPQIENGVGLMRQFLDSLSSASAQGGHACPRRVLIPCGTSIAPYMQNWVDRYGPKEVKAVIQPIKNFFFGETVTVTGLLCGRDILSQVDCSQTDELILCNVTLKETDSLFLDDLSLQEFRDKLPVPLTVIPNQGEALYRALLGTWKG